MPDNIVSSRIKLATKSASDWSTANPTLLSGEVGFDSTNKIIKVGDGSSSWSNIAGWNGMNDCYPTSTSDTAGRWSITIPGIPALYDGLTIKIYLTTSYNSSFNSLNVNNLGEKAVRYRAGSFATSHFPQYSIVELTYKTNMSALSISNAWCDPVNVANYRGAWAASTAYAIGDSVLQSDKYYICKKAHTSDSSWATTNWNASTTPYSTIPVPTSATTITTDGWVAEFAYNSDNNTIGGLYNYLRPYSGAYPIYRYKLCVFNKDNKILPLTLTNQESATQVLKDPLPVAFRPYTIFYYNSQDTLAANTVMAASKLYNQWYTQGASYTFNTAISKYRLVYLKGTYDKSTDLFTLYIDSNDATKSSWYTQVPTNSNNITLSSYFDSGYYYILVGGTYSADNYLDLFDVNTLYYFDGTNLVPQTNQTASQSVSGLMSSTDKTRLDGIYANYVTTDTDQDITGVKTFVGQKKILFKQSGSSDKLGFTLYTNGGTEKGYLEYNPSNTVDGYPLMTIGNYATASGGLTQVGFRRYSSISGANGAYNLLTPMISDAKTPFSLTTTYTNFYLPLGFTDGTTVVKTAKSGMVDLSSLISGGTTLPTTTTANKLLISTSTSGTVKWSDFSDAGFLKTNSSGVASVDTNTYTTTSDFSDLSSSVTILDNTLQSSVSSLSTELDTYKSTANAQISQNADAISTVSSDLSSLDDKYDGITQDIQDDLTALETGDVALNTAFRQSAQNGVYEGLLYYDSSTPVYGTAVGQLTFTTENGNKVIDRTGFYTIYTGDIIAHYQDTTLVAYVQNGKWHSGDSEGQTQTFGRYIVEDDPTDGLVFKWGG